MRENQIIEQYPAPDFMPVLVSEVTRMSRGYYCVAGWDMHARRMVRPLQPSGANWQKDSVGSVFAAGHLVNCVPGPKRGAALPHATEDLPLAGPPALLRILAESATYELLIPAAKDTVREVFGRALIENKYLADGTECSSLGGVRAIRRRTRFLRDAFGKLRFEVHDRDDTVYRLPVTCEALLHIFSPADEDAEPHFGVQEANEWLAMTPPESDIMLRIGLARGWAGSDGAWHPRRCCAQLNGILCPEDNYHIFAGPPSA